MSSRKNSFGLGPHFSQQNKHIPLKKMILRTKSKAVNSFSNVARVKAYLHGTTLSHATSLRQAYDMT